MALARSGYRLALHGSNDVALDPDLERELADDGVQWHPFVADFEQPEAAIALMDAVGAHFGQGPVLLTQALAEREGSGRDRVIINILDQRLAHPHGDQLAYTLSKQALAGFTRVAARELAGRGIRVNAVAPGLTIATGHYDEAQMERLADMMPLGRLPEPAQIAEAVLYLAHAQAVTGQVIAVDGGAHLESYARDFMHL
ncbi:MAG: hypothetical protein B7Z20_09885 [Sphingobium sp. 32-64-5]|nr:MAG: hypothetical protein B7Z20_09885 [Sphingobium sp. 32-64-5]